MATAVGWGEYGSSSGGGKGEGRWRRRWGSGGKRRNGPSQDFLRCSVPFAERTANIDDEMEIDRKEMAEAEAGAAAEEVEYRLRALDFSSLHRAAKVRENTNIGGGGERGGVEGGRISIERRGRKEEEVMPPWGKGISHERHAPIGNDGGAYPSTPPSIGVGAGTTSPSWVRVRPDIKEEWNVFTVRH